LREGKFRGEDVMARARQICLSVLVLFVLAGAVSAETIYVDDIAVGFNNGSSWADAFNYLHDALDSAVDGDNILIAEGTYLPNIIRGHYGRRPIRNTREASFKLKNGVTVKGGYAGYGTADPNERNIGLYETILSGDLLGNDRPAIFLMGLLRDHNRSDNCYHVFYHPDGSDLDSTAVLDGITVAAGNANGSEVHNSGGGMYNAISNSPTLINCTFRDNAAVYGGGLYNGEGSNTQIYNCIFKNNMGEHSGGGMYNADSSSPAVINCTFSENVSPGSYYYGYGGGIYNYLYSSPTVSNCKFINNSARFGGGMFNYEHSEPGISNCIFSDNSAGNGGGMYNNYNNSTVTNCTFRNNTALLGGGIDNWFATVFLSNCSFNGNTARNGGGTASRMNCVLTVINCSFTANSSDEYGGGMYVSGCSLTLINSILWANIASYDNEIYLDGSSCEIAYSNIEGCFSGGQWNGLLGINAGGNIDADPMFVRNPDDGGDGWGDDPATPDVDEGANDDYGDLRLMAGSPCINAGDDSAVPDDVATDLDGNPRVMGLAVDMGAYECQIVNSAPVADAGAGQIVYAGADGTARLKLDGSGSYDPDGDGFSCHWFEDANEIASGVDPNVLFGVGEHFVELVVDDGELSSEPNGVTVMVRPAIEAKRAYVLPRVINASSRGRFVISLMQLPDGVFKDDVASGSMVLEIGGVIVESVIERSVGSGSRNYVFAFFDRSEVIGAVAGKRNCDIVIAGKLVSGQCIFGRDTVRVVRSNGNAYGRENGTRTRSRRRSIRSSRDRR
jgi:hypothetical protein